LQKINYDASSSRSVGSRLAHIPSFLQKQKRIPTTISTIKKTRALQQGIDIEWSIATGQILSVRGGTSDSSDSDEEDEYDVEYDDSDDDEYDEYDTDSEEYDSDTEEEEDGVVSSIKSTSLKTSIKSKSQKSDDIIDYDDMLQPPAMQQMMITVGVMLLSNKIDILNVKAVRIARYAFVSYLVVTQFFLGYVYLRVKSMNDRTSITISNPLAGLVNGAGGGSGSGAGTNFMVKAITNQVLSTSTTIFEYDIKQVKKMNGSLLFPMIMLYFLHFRMKQVQPLLMQTCTGVMNLVYSPLFQVYVLGRNLERPFKPPVNPMMEAMQKQQQELQKAQQGEEAEEEGSNEDGEVVDDSGEESEDEEGEDEESDDEEEYDSDDE